LKRAATAAVCVVVTLDLGAYHAGARMLPETRFPSRVVGLWTRAASAARRADAASASTPGTAERPSARTVTVTGKAHEPAPADGSGQMTRWLQVVVVCAATLIASGNVSATPVAIQSA